MLMIEKLASSRAEILRSAVLLKKQRYWFFQLISLNDEAN
jgi:hypothetical protein